MKIAQVVSSLEARHGGPSRSVRGVAEGLSRIGHTVELLTTAPVGTNVGSGIGSLSLHAYPRQWPSSLSPSYLLQQRLREHRYDVVHNHGLWQRPLHYAHNGARHSGGPLVVSPRGMMSPWAWHHRRWKKLPASWIVHPGALSGADGWHATSAEEAEDIRNLGFKQPICVAVNGVIPPSAKEEAAYAQHWRSLLPALSGRRVALFYSRFHSKKRILELIDLWLSVPRKDWVLLVVGIPEQYTANQVDAYVVRNGGVGSVIVQDGANHPPPYAVAEAFLFPSHSENFGLVVAEALATGVPVLATDSTPWRKLDSVGAGRCVSWDSFGPALSELLASSPEQLRASGQQARSWAREAFSWERTAGILSSFYDQLIAAR